MLLSANPLDDIANTQRIQAVIARGRYYDRAALDVLLEDVERAAQEDVVMGGVRVRTAEEHPHLALPDLLEATGAADAEGAFLALIERGGRR